MNTITIEEVLKKKNINIIDVREIYEFENGSIPGAVNIPMTGLIMNHEKFLNKSETYYIICQAGGRSMQTCMMLEKEGYNVVQIEGGVGTLG